MWPGALHWLCTWAGLTVWAPPADRVGLQQTLASTGTPWKRRGAAATKPIRLERRWAHPISHPRFHPVARGCAGAQEVSGPPALLQDAHSSFWAGGTRQPVPRRLLPAAPTSSGEPKGTFLHSADGGWGTGGGAAAVTSSSVPPCLSSFCWTEGHGQEEGVP